jgi:uncharacterized Zn-binding protein involved in type VI secretion
MRMNKVIAILAISLSVIGVSPAVFAQEIDANGCKDHPLISRMKNYYIASCQTNFDSFDFFIKGGQTKNMEGTRTKIAYAIKEGSPQPSFLQIRRNYGNAFKNIGGTILFDEDRRSTLKVSKEGKETWIALEAFNEGRNYELVILEMEGITQEVTASPAYSEIHKAESRPQELKQAVDQYNPKVNKSNQMRADFQLLTLTYPAGQSPKVFTKGWVFGASCIRGQRDISGNVRWKGTGTFNPNRGPQSWPAFNSPGTNQITLYIEDNGKVVFEKTFTVETVDPKGYARLNDIAICPADLHGCPACPHRVNGPIISGSRIVFIGGIPAACVGDKGIHAACCGPNTYVIKTGDPNVLIEGKPAARLGDQTQHCGGVGQITTAYGKP